MTAAGCDASLLGPRPDLLDGMAAFVELHVEQGRALVPMGAALGLAEGIWPHGRWRLVFSGRADHAGTARFADRNDPMLPYASTVLAARRVAAERGALATFGKVSAEPGGANGVSSAVTAWLDARAPDEEALADTVAEVRSAAEFSCAEHGVALNVRQESYTQVVRFDQGLRDWIAGVLEAAGVKAPVLPTGAGHDAGVLAARVPAAMLFVRNPTGVSHSPAELADLADCEAGQRPRRGPRGPGPVIREGGPPLPARLARGPGLAPRPGCPPRRPDRSRRRALHHRHPRLRLARRSPTHAHSQDAEHLPGLTLPGFANAHSHAFHRALRATTQADRGTFWTWRERMYEVAARLDPDSYLRLARAVYAEMALAGVSCVGEFHYLHHQPGGRPYADPNAMGRALVQAAAEPACG